MSKESLGKMMDRLQDPEFVAAQERYQNYRIAVDKAYKIASEHSSDYVDTGEKDKDGFTISRKLTPEESAASVVSLARPLVAAIYEDLQKAAEQIEKK